MKTKLLTFTRLLNNIIFFILILFLISHAQDPQLMGNLSIELKHSGYIYLNSDLIATESFQNLVLKPGNYNLSVFNSTSRKWSQRGYAGEITVLPGDHLRLSIDYTDYYYINSSPYGSIIYQNEKLLGTTPAFINTHSINNTDYLRLVKEGYKEKIFLISPDKHNYFTHLESKSIDAYNQVAKAGLNNSQTSWLKEGLAVAALLSSWGAFYFKREADQNYNKYLGTGNPAQMTKYYNRTTRLDTYSDISIGISIVSLSTYMYFLIFD